MLSQIISRRAVVGLAAVAGWWAAGLAYAGYVSGTDNLPSPRYESGEIDGTKYTYDGLDRRIGSCNLSLQSQPLPPPDPDAWIESFFDVFYEVEIEPDPGLPVVWSGVSEMHLRITGLTPLGAQRPFEMEILSLQVSDPMNPLNMIRESPSAPSVGTTTLDALGDGTWWVESFFDVYTELSMGGGGIWEPASSTIRLTGVPEPATLSLLAVGGLALARRRRA